MTSPRSRGHREGGPPLTPIPGGSPAERDLANLFRSTATMPPTQHPYALLPSLDYPAKPLIFPSLEALARHIHRGRKGRALVLRDARLTHGGQIRRVTEVLAEDQGASRSDRLGYAWTAGRSREALEAALDAEVPTFAAER